MARIRTIKPELLEDEKVASLPHLEWRLFVSCLLLADDYGNFRAAPGRIHGAALWAHSREGLAKALEALAVVELLTFYWVTGQSYGHVVGWEKHQKVDHPGKPLCPALTEDSRLSRENLAKVLEGLAPDRDRDPDLGSLPSGLSLPSQGSDPDQTPARVEQPVVWPAFTWNRKFGMAWREKYGTDYGNPGDTKHSGTLGDVLSALPDAVKLAAQAEAPRMFREFLAREDARTVERRHPWCFFVADWGGLRVPKLAAAPAKPAAESFADRDAKRRDEERARDRARTARDVAAVNAKSAELQRFLVDDTEAVG